MNHPNRDSIAIPISTQASGRARLVRHGPLFVYEKIPSHFWSYLADRPGLLYL